MKFTELELRPELLGAIDKAGFTDCTEIQGAVIPHVLKGKDVSGLAQTGTGKTGAFVIPLIDRILRARAGEENDRVPKNWRKNGFVLVLVPTRELAAQVENAIRQFGRDAGMRSIVIVGGSEYDDQKRALHSGVEFVVGTPGRLLDLYKSHDLDLNGVWAIVFDEADRMFDMGFKDDMKFILRRVPRDRQFLLFSATLNFDVLNTAYQFGAEPLEFNVSRDQVTAHGIDQEIFHIGQNEKPMYLLSILKKLAPQQCIVFSNFKHNVARIARFLKDNDVEATGMSSLLSQHQRNKVLESFRSGKKQILVATDVAARGLDIKGVDLVVNFDLPEEAEGYVHRIGRTGRAGATGRAIGLVSDRDVESLMRIETYLKEKLKIGWLDDGELTREFKAFPTESDLADGRPTAPVFRRQGAQHPPRGRRPHPPHRPPAKPQQRPAHGSRPAAQEPQGVVAHSSEHRDRKLGRHQKDQAQANRPHRRGFQQKRHQGQQQHQSHRRPLNKSHPPTQATAQKSQSLGTKVRGFLSKLFKG